MSDFLIENGILKKYTGPGGAVVVPEGVTELCWKAFAGQKTVTSVKLPDSLEVVDDAVFQDCTGMTGLRVPASVKQLGREDVEEYIAYVFDGCKNLRELVLEGETDFCRGTGFKAGKPRLFSRYPKGFVLVAPKIPLERIQDTETKRAMTRGFLQNSGLFAGDIRKGYEKYILRKVYLATLLGEDDVQSITRIAEAGLITGGNLHKLFLDPAVEAGARECKAFLLDWKDKNGIQTADAEPALSLSAKLPRSPAAGGDPFDEKLLKKSWNYEIRENGIRLTLYKGKETQVVVPNRIGSTPVEVIGSGAFRGGPQNKQSRQISTIVSVEIMEGIKELEAFAFKTCQSLEVLKIPKSVKKLASSGPCITKSVRIGFWAVDDCPKLTIYGKAGSRAEKFAKEQNIPFAAE